MKSWEQVPGWISESLPTSACYVLPVPPNFEQSYLMLLSDVPASSLHTGCEVSIQLIISVTFLCFRKTLTQGAMPQVPHPVTGQDAEHEMLDFEPNAVIA